MSAQPPFPPEPKNVYVATGEPVGDSSAASPRYSFKGWLLSVWLAKNATYVKTVLAALFTALSAIFATGNGEAVAQAFLAFGSSVVMLASKCALDAFEYFVKENPR